MISYNWCWKYPYMTYLSALSWLNSLTGAHLHKTLRPIAAYVLPWTAWVLVQVMACHLCSAKPLLKTCSADLMSIGLQGRNFDKIWMKIQKFSVKKMYLKCHVQNFSHFVLASVWQVPSVWVKGISHSVDLLHRILTVSWTTDICGHYSYVTQASCYLKL